MAATETDKDKAGVATEAVAPSTQQEPSPPPQPPSAASSDDGAVSEAGEIAASAGDSSGDAPPLPDEALPEDDGWYHQWEPAAGRWIFINRYTGKRQWENPRVPEADAAVYGHGHYDRFAPRLEKP